MTGTVPDARFTCWPEILTMLPDTDVDITPETTVTVPDTPTLPDMITEPDVIDVFTDAISPCPLILMNNPELIVMILPDTDVPTLPDTITEPDTITDVI